MKITTWNVNGYRAVLAKQGFDWVKEHQPDILCLQEIKVKPEQLTEDQRELPGYQSFWNPAERPGYSGTAVFYKIAPLEISTGLGVEEFDSEGRVTRLRYPDFLLYIISPMAAKKISGCLLNWASTPGFWMFATSITSTARMLLSPAISIQPIMRLTWRGQRTTRKTPVFCLKNGCG